jgi:hypothetical protein
MWLHFFRTLERYDRDFSRGEQVASMWATSVFVPVKMST